MTAPAPRENVPLATLAALITVQVLFGMFPVAGKFAIAGFGAGGVSAARILGAAVVFQVVRMLRREPSVPWRAMPMFIVCAALGIASNQLLFLYGLARTSATHAALLTTLIPVFTSIFAIAMGRERFRWQAGAGIVVALSGAVALISGRNLGGQAALIGDLMIVANTFVYSAFLILSRDLLATWPPLTAVAWFFTWAIPMVLPVTGLPPVSGASDVAWGALAFCVLGPTIGSYFLNLFALRQVPSSVVALFIYLQPFVAALFASWWLGEQLTARTVVAGVLSFAGVWLATRKGAERRRST